MDRSISQLEVAMSSWLIIGIIILAILVLMSVGNVGGRGDHTVNAQRWWHKHE
ncbi:hypothetical protein [Nocardioides sp.]|uniref:hypothetical protein n=1 Tax=Nocardioides sp. TaxID=35761 RepID=UPI0035AEFF38